MGIGTVIKGALWLTNKGANMAVTNRIKGQILQETGVRVSNSFALEYNRIQMGMSTAGGRQTAMNNLNRQIVEMGGQGNLSLGTLRETDARKRIAKGNNYKHMLAHAVQKENPDVKLGSTIGINELETLVRRKRETSWNENFGNRQVAVIKAMIQQQIDELNRTLERIVEHSGGDRRNSGNSQHNIRHAANAQMELMSLMSRVQSISEHVFVDDFHIGQVENFDKRIAVMIHSSAYGDTNEMLEDASEVEWYHYINSSTGVGHYVQEVDNFIEGLGE